MSDSREAIAAAMYAVEYDSTEYEFQNAHEATRTILLKMADAAIARAAPRCDAETDELIHKLRADAIRSEKVTGEPKDTWLSWVAADFIERVLSLPAADRSTP